MNCHSQHEYNLERMMRFQCQRSARLYRDKYLALRKLMREHFKTHPTSDEEVLRAVGINRKEI